MTNTNTTDTEERYTFTNGFSMKRAPRPNFFWELRDGNGELVQRDQYRHDLISRHDLTILEHTND